MPKACMLMRKRREIEDRVQLFTSSGHMKTSTKDVKVSKVEFIIASVQMAAECDTK
jgi:hypothetical protein